MEYVMSTAEQIEQLMAHDHKGPIIMVNLLRFKPDGGAESYRKYSDFTSKYIKDKLGGRVVYGCKMLMPVIGEEEWDEVKLVEYPSIASFIEMQIDKEYQKMLKYRTEALIDSRLYLTVQADSGE